MRNWIRNTLRKMRREAFAEDLRLIRPEFRHLYRGNMGNPGSAIGALFQAFDRGHLKDE